MAVLTDLAKLKKLFVSPVMTLPVPYSTYLPSDLVILIPLLVSSPQRQSRTRSTPSGDNLPRHNVT